MLVVELLELKQMPTHDKTLTNPYSVRLANKTVFLHASALLLNAASFFYIVHHPRIWRRE